MPNHGETTHAPSLDRWDRRLAAPMSAAALALLAWLGIAAEWLRVGEGRLPAWLLGLLAGGYAAFVVEFLFHALRRDPYWRQRLPACVLPPLRLCARDYRSPQWVWVPFRGWVERSSRLVLELERAFSLPMIGVAMMILPLLAVEHFWAEALADRVELRTAVSLGTCVVWLAFAVEFFVMVAVVEKKLDYCKRHWLDMVVIVLPFVAFLRFLRLGQALRLHQISRLSRAYRLRGLTTRAWRSVLLLDLIARLMRIRPEKQLERLRSVIEEKEAELAALRERMRELEFAIAAAAEQNAQRAAGSPPAASDGHSPQPQEVTP